MQQVRSLKYKELDTTDVPLLEADLSPSFPSSSL